MIIPSKINSLFGVVGWNQSTITGYDIVDAENLGSTSGLKFQDVSSLVSIKNIKDNQENKDITDVQFNTLLDNMQYDCIRTICNKITTGESDEIMSFNLYPYEKAFNKTLTHNSNFVGFRIQPNKGIDYINNIKWLELSFDSEATFNIYLYNSNLSDPIQNKSVTTSANESVIVDLDWNLTDDLTYKGGVFYIGYFESDLGGAKAIYRDYENAQLKINNKYFCIEPCYTDYSGTNINVQNVEYAEYVYGLNIGMNIYKDFTQLLLRNEQILAEAIQLQMAEKVLNLMKFTTRSNATEAATTRNIDFELYGNPELKIYGVFQRLENKIKDIKKILFNQNPIILGTLS